MTKAQSITIILLFLSVQLNSQSSENRDFIVTSAKDTIYVDKIKNKYDKIIVKKDKKRTKYSFEKIMSYYVSKNSEYYEKVISPFIVEQDTYDADSDRYDYRKREMSFLKGKVANNNVSYTFLRRLTTGKVKLFSHTINQSGGLMSPTNPFPTPGYSNTSYFIAIHDSKPEPITSNNELKLKNDVYNILKIYLHGNNEIKKRLDNLYLSKPKAKKKQIVNLIIDYNKWVESKK
mgnify:CR=1 FL=1